MTVTAARSRVDASGAGEFRTLPAMMNGVLDALAPLGVRS
jgi:hypothetical protein